MNRIRIALGALFLMLAVSAPTLAENRVNNYYGMVLDQNWLNQAERNPRTGLGQLVYDITGSTSPFFANLVGLPSGGLYMSIGPPTTNSMGALYQYLPDDITPVGGSPIGAIGSTTLAADPTTFFLQGLVSSPNITVGPFTPPATSGQSIAYLAECQVQTIDRILQLESFEQLPNYTPASGTANEARADVTVCQSKPSSPATSPITPTVDSGWVSFATVTVPAGTTSLAPSNIVRTASTQFYGFVPANASGGVTLPHGDYANANLSNVPPTTGLSIASLILAANGAPSPTFPTIANDAAPGPGFNLSVPNTSTYGFRYFNVTSNGTLTQIGHIDASGNATYAGTVAADAFNVTHNLTISGNVVGNSGSSISIGSGSFSSQVTSPTYILQANDPTTAYIGLSNGNNGFRIAQPGAGTTVQGIQCTLVGIAQSNVGYKACMNQNGDLGVTGSLLAQSVQSVGTVYSKSAPVAPVFNASGTAVSNTWHEVYVTGTTASSQSNCGVTSNYYCATVNLSGSATFASNLTFSCDPASTVQNSQPFSGPAGNGGGVYLAGASSGSTLFFGSATNGGATFSTVCRGT